MNDKELERFYKRQCVLSSMEAKQGKVPRVCGVSYQCTETGKYMVSEDGKPRMITPDEYRELLDKNKIIFGHKKIIS